MLTTVVLAVILAVTGVHSACDEKLVAKIKSENGAKQEKLLKELSGTVLWLTIPHFYEKQADKLTCGRSLFSADESSVVSIADFSDVDGPVLRSGSFKQEEAGSLIYLENGVPNGEKLYFVSFGKRAYSYVVCNEKTDAAPFAGVNVRNVNRQQLSSDKNLLGEVAEAFKSLAKLNLVPGKAIQNNCAKCDFTSKA